MALVAVAREQAVVGDDDGDTFAGEQGNARVHEQAVATVLGAFDAEGAANAGGEVRIGGSRLVEVFVLPCDADFRADVNLPHTEMDGGAGTGAGAQRIGVV